MIANCHLPRDSILASDFHLWNKSDIWEKWKKPQKSPNFYTELVNIHLDWFY